MNYLIARVSDPDQKKALPAQKQKLYDYASRKTDGKEPWTEDQDFEYIEFDETAYKEDRKDFNKLVIEPLQKIKPGEKTIVVFDKIDRFSRDSSSEERRALTKLFRDGRIELHFPSDNLFIHKDSPAPDLFRLDIGIALAGYYSSAIRDNVRRRFDQMLRDGIWVGKAPIGYLNYQEKGDDGKIIKGIKVDPERSPYIIKGFELRSTGLPYRSIAKEMKKRGLRGNTKFHKPITTSQWEEILNNPFYIGKMRYMGKEYDHNYPTFIDQWLWDRCQEVKSQRSNGRTKYNSKAFLFKKLKCHDCGYTVSFYGPVNGNNYGQCTQYSGKHGAPIVNEKILLSQVRNVLASITVPKEILPDLVAEIEENHASEQEYYLNTRNRLQREYKALDEEVQELFKDRKQFKSRPDIFERMVKEIEAKQKKILDDLEDHGNGDKAFAIGASYILEVCSRAVELFDAESSKVEQKRYLLDFVLSNLTLDGENLRFTLKEPFDAIALMAKTQDWYPG